VISQMSKLYCLIMMSEIIIAYSVVFSIFSVWSSGPVLEVYTLSGKLNQLAMIFVHLLLATVTCIVAVKSPQFTIYTFLIYLAYVFYGIGVWPEGQYTQEFIDYVASMKIPVPSPSATDSVTIRLENKVYPFFSNRLLYVAGGVCAVYLSFWKDQASRNKTSKKDALTRASS